MKTPSLPPGPVPTGRLPGVRSAGRLLAGLLFAGLLLPGRLPAQNYHPDRADLKSAPPANAALPSLFLVGDSTAGRAVLLNRADLENRRKNPTIGWGFPFAEYFDRGRINVVLRAEAASTRSYRTTGLWAKVLAELKPGDLVLLQFGQLERAPLDDPHHGSGPLPGIGEESQVVHGETVHTFGWYLRTDLAELRARGAVPIILGPSVRNRWTDGRVDRGPDGVRDWAAAVARSEHAAFVDVTDLVADRYESMGQKVVRTFYYNELVHTNLDGARVDAALIVSGLKALTEPALTPYLSPRGVALPTAPPAYALAREP
jgi:lysophospholipase L1-like esterase